MDAIVGGPLAFVSDTQSSKRSLEEHEDEEEEPVGQDAKYRGAYIYPAVVGMHLFGPSKVCIEIDMVSAYPRTMRNFNICPHSRADTQMIDFFLFLRKQHKEGGHIAEAEAAKLAINTMYGMIGSQTADNGCRELAAAVTASQRAAFRRAIDHIQTIEGATILMGDSDSIILCADSALPDLEKQLLEITGMQFQRKNEGREWLMICSKRTLAGGSKGVVTSVSGLAPVCFSKPLHERAMMECVLAEIAKDPRNIAAIVTSAIAVTKEQSMLLTPELMRFWIHNKETLMDDAYIYTVHEAGRTRMKSLYDVVSKQRGFWDVLDVDHYLTSHCVDPLNRLPINIIEH
jgi:hypothetical protein